MQNSKYFQGSTRHSSYSAEDAPEGSLLSNKCKSLEH